LANITRADITRLCERYKHNKPRLRELLLAIFERRENIHLFAWFVSPNYHPLETPEFHREILGDISNPELPLVGFAAPRGHAKSTLVCHDYLLWAVCFRKVHFPIVISDTYSQSVEFVNALKDEFEGNTIIRWLFGDLTGDYWRDGDFVTSTGIKVVALGYGMKVRGLRHREHRPDLLIFDDLENDEQVASAEQRKKIKRWLTKAALGALKKEGGRAIKIGTILHHDSLLNNIIKNNEMFESWHTRLYVALNTDKKGREYALWPEHESVEYLKAIRDNPVLCKKNGWKFIGSLAFAQERQNKPINEEDAIIQPDWIQWCDAREVPQDDALVATVLTVDPAASEKQTADPTGKIVASLGIDGNIYVRAVGNRRLSPARNTKEIEDLNIVFEPNAIGVENGVLELVFKELLAGLPTVGLKADKDKVRRLLAVARFFEAGRIFIVKKIRNGQALYDQLVEFPNASHDDMVDALVYAIRMLLVDGMLADDDEAETAGDYKRGNPTYEDDDDEDW
jgi:predicted phage terminase large subunit-like protein